jgi:formylglycine-generating enzyme required for sulfatase activity
MNTQNPTQIEKSYRWDRLERVNRGRNWDYYTSINGPARRSGGTPTYRYSTTGFRLVRNK